MTPEAPHRYLRLVTKSERRPRIGSALESATFALGREAGPGGGLLQIDTKTRSRHAYVTGKPGSGKSTLLLNLVLHDLEVGNGCCVLDPHGGLVEAILASAAASSDRLVVVDAADIHRPVGIDLLAARDEHEQDLVVQFFLDLFMRMYLAEQIGPVLFQAVRNGLLLMMNVGRTLAEFPLIFCDEGYLERILPHCTDPFVLRYFQRIWNKTSGSHKGDMIAYITSKFSPFFEDRLMRGILSQRGGLDFDDVLASRKVVLVHLARGRIGDFNARLLGQIVLHLVRRSAMRRDAGAQHPFFSVVVDEAHEFGGSELREMLTGLRKFHVGVVMANQSIADLSPSLRETVLGSVGSFVLLRQGLQFQPEIEELVAPRYDSRDLARLPDFTAVACTEADGCEVVRRIGLSPPPLRVDRRRARLARLLSALRYGRPRREIESNLLAAATGAEPAVAEGWDARTTAIQHPRSTDSDA